MASKIKRFREDVMWVDREGSSYNFERTESKALKRFDRWRAEKKPTILSTNFGRHIAKNSLDLDKSPRYFYLRVLYDESNPTKIKRAEEKENECR